MRKIRPVMDETFTITYQTENGLIKGKTLLITSPQMNKKQAGEFVGAIRAKKLRKITVNGTLADSEKTLEILRAAKVFLK